MRCRLVKANFWVLQIFQNGRLPTDFILIVKIFRLQIHRLIFCLVIETSSLSSLRLRLIIRLWFLLLLKIFKLVCKHLGQLGSWNTIHKLVRRYGVLLWIACWRSCWNIFGIFSGRRKGSTSSSWSRLLRQAVIERQLLACVRLLQLILLFFNLGLWSLDCFGKLLLTYTILVIFLLENCHWLLRQIEGKRFGKFEFFVLIKPIVFWNAL